MTMKWQNIVKYAAGGSLSLITVLILVLNLSGMEYSIPPDQWCDDCYSLFCVNSTVWEIKVEHAGEKDIIFAKRMSSRTRWLNLDKIDEFIPTSPNVPVEILVKTNKKYAEINHPLYGYLRKLKDGDSLIKRRHKKYNPSGTCFIIHGKTGGKTVKWGMDISDYTMENIVYDPIWYGSGNDDGLILHMPFETGANDLSGHGNDGTVDGCKVGTGVKGKGYTFDGVDDNVNIDNWYPFDNNQSFSISVWVNLKANTDDDDYIISNSYPGGGGNRNFGIFLYQNNVAYSEINVNIANDTNCSNPFVIKNNFAYNEWHHIAVTYDSSSIIDNFKAYFDGTLEITESLVGFSPVQEESSSYDNLMIGNYDRQINQRSFNGSIDEVRIYNRSLSASEIKNLYNTSSYKFNLKTSALNGLVDESDLIYHYPFDSRDGSNDSIVIDIGPNKLNGTVVNDAKQTKDGKFREAYDFTPIGNSIDVPIQNDNSTLVLAPWCMSAWANARATAGYIVALRRPRAPWQEWAVYFDSNNGRIKFHYQNSTGSSYTIGSVSEYHLNDWYHIVACIDETNTTHLFVNGSLQGYDTVDGGVLVNDTAFLRIGSDWLGSEPTNFNGTIDDIRFYSKNLSVSEIESLYYGEKSSSLILKTAPSNGLVNNSGLVGEWHFDRKDGSNSSIAIDTSGNGNDGVVDGAGASNDGRFKESYIFNGISDEIKVDDDQSLNFSETGFSIFSWIKTDVLDKTQEIINKGDSSATGKGIHFYISNDDLISVVYNSSGHKTDNLHANSIDTNWHHVGMVLDLSNNNLTLWFDGNLVSEDVCNGFNESDADLYIGIYKTGVFSFNGTIDEVKIYNRSLNTDEIQSLYQGEKSNYFILKSTVG